MPFIHSFIHSFGAIYMNNVLTESKLRQACADLYYDGSTCLV